MLFPKADHFGIHHLISCKCMGAFWAIAVGFEPHPAFYNKNNSTWVDSGVCWVCRGCPRLSMWVGGQGVKFTFGQGNVHVCLGHSAASFTCFTLLSNITLRLRLSRLEWLSVRSAKYLFYWTPQQLNLATWNHLTLSSWTLWAARDCGIWQPNRGEVAAAPCPSSNQRWRWACLPDEHTYTNTQTHSNAKSSPSG